MSRRRRAELLATGDSPPQLGSRLRKPAGEEQAEQGSQDFNPHGGLYPEDEEDDGPAMGGDFFLGDAMEVDDGSSDSQDESDNDSIDTTGAIIDLEDADLEDIREEVDVLPAGFDETELQAARDYNDILDEMAPMIDAMAFDEVVPDETEASEKLNADILDEQTPIVDTITDPSDPSVLIPHRQNRFNELSDFNMAFGLFAHIFGINRTQYAALREVMGLLTVNDRPHPNVQALPSQLSTLKDNVSRRFPLLDMRKAEVPLRVEKLPTERATRKIDEREQTGKEITADLHFIDPFSLFKTFLSSDVAKNMHSGLAHFVDEPTELYHSHSWASSVRTTSGEYAHIQYEVGDDEQEDDTNGEVIFPSDFVLYCCTDLNCCCQTASGDDPALAHLGRVYGVGKDFRSEFCTNQQGDIVLQIQEAFGLAALRHPQMIPPYPGINDQDPNEYILNLTPVYIPQTHLIAPSPNIACDYFWGEEHSDPSPAVQRKGGKAPKKAKKTHPKYSHQPPIPQQPFVVRRGITSQQQIIPLCHTHPIRAELELETYGRPLFEYGWDGHVIVSCPILVFIDGFGLYRNSYRSLIGVYAIIANLNGEERHRQANIFPLTLSPHGSNFDDTIRALQSLGTLDRGQLASINDEEVVICVPTLCYIGDMPQQDKNSGFRGPKALKFCRFCAIGQQAVKSGEPSSVLDFDVVTHGRYHRQLVEMRKSMASLKTAASQKEFGSQWGMSEEAPVLAELSPALDLILSRPPDPAHSEYNGLSELMHGLLLDRVLTTPAAKEYTRQLRLWPFPPGWERLQSPLHHLRSYSLAAHARWSVIVPGLLRRWLKKEHIHRLFSAEAQRRLHLSDSEVVDFIVSAFAKLAKSNSVLMGLKVAPDDRRNMVDIILDARRTYQQLCMCTSSSIVANPRAYSQFSSRHGSLAPSARGSVEPPQTQSTETQAMPPPPPRLNVLATIEETAGDEQQEAPKRASQYLHDAVRPNIHLGVHYPMIAEEYGLPVNVNTLLGESQHRWFKKKVYETNHSQVEKLLLAKVNMQLTIRLILRNAFYFEDGELTSKMNNLYKSCPNLLDAILPRTDRRDILQQQQVEDEDFEMEVLTGVDEAHRHATVIGQVPPSVIRQTTHSINDDQVLPNRHDNMVQGFKEALRLAYVEHYNHPEIYRFGNKRMQYSNKFGFTDRSVQSYQADEGRLGP